MKSGTRFLVCLALFCLAPVLSSATPTPKSGPAATPKAARTNVATQAAQVHVVVDSAKDIEDSAWARMGVLATLSLGLVALLALAVGDFRQRQALTPIVDVSDVKQHVSRPTENGVAVEVAEFEMTVCNSAGGPALDIYLTLESYGGVTPLRDPIAYLSPLSPGACRLSRHSFHLPPKQGKAYEDNDVYAFSMTWRGTFAKGGRTYVGPDSERDRLTVARVPFFSWW